MQLKLVLFATAVALSGFGAQAQTQAPGLWEHSFTMKSDDAKMEKAMAEMQKQLAAMPPEQRKQMEWAMASRGVKMGAGGSSVKVCITKEEAAKPPEARMTGDCKQSDVQRSGNTMKYKFTCTQPQQISGDGQVSFVGDKAYSGKSNVTTQVNGQPQQMTMDMSGKWLGADCGDVKPAGALPAK